MKCPILPVSANTGGPQPLPARTGMQDSCSLSDGPLLAQPALLGTVAGASGLHSPCLVGEPTGYFLGAAQPRSGTRPSLLLGVEFINILSLLHFSALPAFLPFSLPK